eukprot:Gb_19720 [translate_table: standard]
MRVIYFFTLVEFQCFVVGAEPLKAWRITEYSIDKIKSEQRNKGEAGTASQAVIYAAVFRSVRVRVGVCLGKHRLKMTGNGSTSQACAACKYQRRKCSPECPLAPYFPPDQPKQFLNAHKLFGVSNILRILKQLDDSQKSDAMKSIVYQANAREKDPVHGCFGIIMMLQTQVERLKEELELVRSQVMFFEQQQQNRDSVSYLPQQPQIQSTSVAVSHALPTSWIYPYVHSASPYMGFDGQTLYRQCFDIKPDIKLLEYEQKQTYIDSKEAYDSSAESSLKNTQSLEHIPEHHELKSAAALFRLTSQH